MIPVERSHLYVAVNSHAGMSGKNNEDRYAVSAFQLAKNNPTPVVFAVVSDGIGGHRAGENAAEIAVETISEDVAHSDASHPVRTLREAIIHASNMILAESETDIEKKGMGATCACAWVIDDQMYTATVGDSRIYLIRGDQIQQISTDHTWIQEALSAGLLTPEETRNHPNAHVIRRYLGSRQIVEPDTRLKLSATDDDAQAEANQGYRLQPKDQILMCSDGLTDLVNDDEILQALKTKGQEQAVESLIALANQRGGHDNITIVTLGLPEKISQTKPLPPPTFKLRQRSLRVPCLVSAILVFLMAATLAGGIFIYTKYFRSATPPTAGTPVEASQPALTTPGTAMPADLTATSAAILNPALTPENVTPGVPTPTLTYWPTDTPSP
jgi:serine/threonine protein phosphatase PrpC